MKRFVKILVSLCLVAAMVLPLYGIDTEEVPCNFYILNDDCEMPYSIDAEPKANYTYAGEGIIRNPIAVFDENGVQVDYTAPAVELNEGESIIWYVCKYDDSDGWHIDGLVVRDNPIPEPPTAETKTIRIDTPKRMGVRFEDGGVFYDGDFKEIEINKEYKFQIFSVNWSNNIFDENNGLLGSVVYTMKAVSLKDFKDLVAAARSDTTRYTIKGDDLIDNDAKTIYINAAAENFHLETDVYNFFAACRFHYGAGNDYMKKVGIDKVVVPTESLSINLPLGTAFDIDCYIGDKYAHSEGIYVEQADSSCVNDYYWN